MPTNLKRNAKKGSGMLSVEETNAMLAEELAEEERKEQGLLPTSGEPKAPEVPLSTSVSVESSGIKCFHRTRVWVRWSTLTRAQGKHLPY